ncbi:Dps family protein [Oceanobacillus sp. CAU 1775]
MAMEHSHIQHHASAASMTNHIVANLGVLYVKLHQYHWYVQGPKFYTLHAKFEELYNDVTANFDALAERLIALGEKPYSTLGEYLEHASIEENVYDKKISAEKMVENLVEDYRTIRDITNRGIDLAGKENDTVTEDLLIGYKESVELTIWMLQAFLGKDATE